LGPGPIGAGVLFARPLVGSGWTARRGPLAEKTPTPLKLQLGVTRNAVLLATRFGC
jgi:hypothetical protein